MSPVSPFLIFPGVCAYVSQIDLPLPSASGEPSIWYADCRETPVEPFREFERRGPLLPRRLCGLPGRRDVRRGGGSEGRGAGGA